MKVVTARLGDRIHHTADSAAEISRVHTAVDRELTHRRLRRGVPGAGTPALFREERLVIIGAVDLDHVQQLGDRPEAQKTKAV